RRSRPASPRRLRARSAATAARRLHPQLFEGLLPAPLMSAFVEVVNVSSSLGAVFRPRPFRCLSTQRSPCWWSQFSSARPYLIGLVLPVRPPALPVFSHRRVAIDMVSGFE